MLQSLKKIMLNCFLSLFLFGIFILIMSAKAIAQSSDFTGSWKLNKEQTDFGNVTEYSTPVRLIVAQKKDSIKIERILINERQETHSNIEFLAINGGKSEIKLNERTQKTASIAWASDGRSLTELATYIDNSVKMEYTGTEVWSLSAEGKTLVIAKSNELPGGKTYLRKMIYEKQ